MKYARIIKLLAEKLNVTEMEAMDLLYGSQTFELIQNGIADMHCFSDLYLADEIILEKRC